MTRPRFALVTAGDANGRRLSQVLARLDIEHSIFSVAHAPPRRKSKSLQVHLRNYLRAHLAAIPTLRRIRQKGRGPFAQPANYVGFCNGPTMKTALRKFEPDYILMMGGGIIDGEVISFARRGVLNAHPGLLPWIRGVDVIRHAVLRQVPVGVTAHFIDKGIDTGAIIDRVRLSIHDGDSHDRIQERADEICVSFMAKIAQEISQGMHPTGEAQSDKFPYCRLLSEQNARAADMEIEAGTAAALFNEGSSFSHIRDDSELRAFYDRVWPETERF